MMPKIQLNEIQSAEDLRNFFLGNKQELRWMFWEHYTPYRGTISGRSRVEWTCEETGGAVMLNGIGEKAINVNSHWYNYEKLYQSIKQGYKYNSFTLNSLFCTFIDGYEYKKPTEQDMIKVIKNRKNAQYLLVSEIPNYISLRDLKKCKAFNDLPILKVEI